MTWAEFKDDLSVGSSIALKSLNDVASTIWANANGRLSEAQILAQSQENQAAIDRASGGNTALAAAAKAQAAKELAISVAASNAQAKPWFTYAIYGAIALVIVYGAMSFEHYRRSA